MDDDRCVVRIGDANKYPDANMAGLGVVSLVIWMITRRGGVSVNHQLIDD